MKYFARFGLCMAALLTVVCNHIILSAINSLPLQKSRKRGRGNVPIGTETQWDDSSWLPRAREVLRSGHPVLVYNEPAFGVVWDQNIPCNVPCVFQPVMDGAHVAIFHIPEHALHRRRCLASETSAVANREACKALTLAHSLESSEFYPLENLEMFDGTSTYKLDSDIPATYFEVGKYKLHGGPVEYETADRSSSFIASNCIQTRLDYVKRLMAVSPVAALGGCLRNTDIPAVFDKGQEIKKYLFHLAFENSLDQDYVTEKVYEALEGGTVPVYLSAPNIRRTCFRATWFYD